MVTVTDVLFTPETPAAAAEWPVELSPAERALARLIPVYGLGGELVGHAIVDSDTYPALSRFRWYMSKGYARRESSLGTVRVHLPMHRVVMCCWPNDGLEVDHINRCRLDNRRANLRYATHLENCRNRAAPYTYMPRPDVVRRFRARPVWQTRERLWRARFQHTTHGRRVVHSVGWFKTCEEADQALTASIAEHERAGCDG
jgi:hypothetical protein